MPPRATPKIYRVARPFITVIDGREIPVLVNDKLYPENHPLVKRFRDAFVEAELEPVAAPPVVVEATANPGEAR